MRSSRTALAFAVASALAGCSPASGRDVVPETRDVREAPDAGGAPAARSEGYAYVARRPHGAVGLVGAHFMSEDDAHHIVERIADELEKCALRLEPRGGLVAGAVQLVAMTGPRGTAEVTDIRVAPGGPVAANALECMVAPLRASPFPPPTRAGTPALAVEATWAPNTGRDAGASP